MSSIHSCTRSPGLRKRLRPMPTPAGVPVRIEVARLQRDARGEHRDLLGGVEDHLAGVRVLHQLVVDPELDAELVRIPISLAGTIHGPSGQAPSKHFWLTQS